MHLGMNMATTFNLGPVFEAKTGTFRLIVHTINLVILTSAAALALYYALIRSDPPPPPSAAQRGLYAPSGMLPHSKQQPLPVAFYLFLSLLPGLGTSTTGISRRSASRLFYFLG